MEKNKNVNEVNDALSEVYDIILHMDIKIRDRIPKNFIRIIKKYRSKDYYVNIDYSKNIYEQEILHSTKVILSIIYRDFLVDSNTKLKLQKNDYRRINEKYSIDNLLKKIV